MLTPDVPTNTCVKICSYYLKGHLTKEGNMRIYLKKSELQDEVIFYLMLMIIYFFFGVFCFFVLSDYYLNMILLNLNSPLTTDIILYPYRCPA